MCASDGCRTLFVGRIKIRNYKYKKFKCVVALYVKKSGHPIACHRTNGNIAGESALVRLWFSYSSVVSQVAYISGCLFPGAPGEVGRV